MKVLGVDPGGTTGLALLDTDEQEFEFPYDGQLGPQEHHYKLFDLVHLLGPDVIACERFDYRRNLTNVELSPVGYIGVLKAACVDARVTKGTEVKLVLQKQLKGKKGLWTDEKLKALDLYTPAMSHKNDAIRQALYYVTTELKDMYWVNQYGSTQE